MQPEQFLQYGSHGLLALVLFGIYKLSNRVVSKWLSSIDAQTKLLAEIADAMRAERYSASKRHRQLMSRLTNGHDDMSDEEDCDERRS